jgi:hypothetical protein
MGPGPDGLLVCMLVGVLASVKAGHESGEDAAISHRRPSL